ncbi:hypothetical protein D1AOALGA4SA_6215 [Olavius algarvensis Delta 1 endosymbiont]|nr:hypothetical protein D1AOALGA4SA_6215 [Olavius algarvensis Delta 1 endosymbiont]
MSSTFGRSPFHTTEIPDPIQRKRILFILIDRAKRFHKSEIRNLQSAI